jgi:hypothetical protein
VLQQGLDPAEEPLPQLVGAMDRDR